MQDEDQLVIDGSLLQHEDCDVPDPSDSDQLYIGQQIALVPHEKRLVAKPPMSRTKAAEHARTVRSTRVLLQKLDKTRVEKARAESSLEMVTTLFTHIEKGSPCHRP